MMSPMSIYEHPINTLDGEPSSLAEHEGRTLLLVNVASRCGLTPQYTGLEELQQTYGDRGFSVLGFPCNQFGAQEPGSAEEIATFCSTTYGVTFPMFEKIDVNGPGRHPIYEELTDDRRRRRARRRHPLELREVPGRTRRVGHPVRPDGRARRARAGDGHRGRPARLRPVRRVPSTRRLAPLMSKKTKKKKARMRRSKANHGKRPNMGRG